MAERYFTPAEVEALIPRLTEILEDVKALHTELATARERLNAEQERITMSGGGVLDARVWREDTAAIERLTGRIQARLQEIVRQGGAPKDLGLGLVDFPHLRNGEVVNLCWKYGERAITHWHRLDEGFSARKPL
jgi:hypothetical protein